MSAVYRSPYGQKRNRKKLWMALLCVALVLVLLAAVVVVGLWVFNLYHGYVIDDESAPSSSMSDESLHFTEADTRHTLFLSVDSGAVTGAALVRFDPAEMRVTVLSVPIDVALPYGTAHKKLATLYAESGVRPVQEALGGALGLTVRSTAVLTADGISNWVERLGSGLPVTVSSPVSAGPLQLEPGPHTLTAAQVLQLLRAEAGSERLSWLLTALGNRYLSAGRNLMTDFDRLTATWNTASTMRRTDVIAYRTVLEAMAAANSGALCRAETLPGERVGAGDALRFELPDDVQQVLQTIF